MRLYIDRGRGGKENFKYYYISLTIKGCVRLCVCHMMSTHNFSEARAVTELNI